MTDRANHTITYLRIVQVEPKKWRCDVATVKEPAEEADDDDDDDEKEEDDEEDDGEGNLEEQPPPGKYSP